MPEQVYLTRDPIVDRHGSISAYAFYGQTEGIPAEAFDNTTALFTTNYSVGKLPGFIAIPACFLGVIEPPPADRTVIELGPDVTAEHEDLCRELRGRGHRLALGGFDFAQNRMALLPLAKYVKFNTRKLPADKVPGLIKLLKSKYDSRVVAEGITGWLAGQELGYDAFQGDTLAPPPDLDKQKDGLTPSQACVVDVLDKVRRNADIRDIEAAFRGDAALSFKLITHINSAGFGLNCEIQSIRHALTILGSQPLYRWVTVLLAQASADSGSPTLATTAIIRGRLTELLGLEFLERSEGDNLFIVGIFSVLDAMLGKPMAEVLETIHLAEEISEALLHHEGIYGPFLALAEACEGREPEQLARKAEEIGLDPVRVNNAHLAALAWAAQIRS